MRNRKRTDPGGRVPFLGHLPSAALTTFALAAPTLGARGACAQQAVTSATLGGRVEDSNGAVMPGVTVTAAAESVVVTAAEAPAVETARTQVAETVAAGEIDSLPLNRRDSLDLAALAPCVSRTNPVANQRFPETSAVPGAGLSITGQHVINNGFVVDGLSATDDAAGLAGSFYSQEVIREFEVVTSGGVAEFGRAPEPPLERGRARLLRAHRRGLQRAQPREPPAPQQRLRRGADAAARLRTPDRRRQSSPNTVRPAPRLITLTSDLSP